MTQLSIFLAHRFAWLRKVVAARLVEVLIVYSDRFGVSDNNINEVIELLEEFDWQESSVEKVRSERNKICNLLNIPIPKVVVKT
jgi:hypothetical protein